jgi:F-type H+-transporting ATPase subunit alpha
MSNKESQAILETLDKTADSLVNGVPNKDQAGIIVESKDGVVSAVGLKASLGEYVLIPEAAADGMVMQLEGDTAYVATLSGASAIKEGLMVVPTGDLLSIPVSEHIIGRVVSPLGMPLDGKPKHGAENKMPLESKAPSVMERQSVFEPLLTGITAIDGLVPIGRGQRELIIGDRKTGKTAVAIDTILNQKGKDVVCIYVSIGQRDSKVATIIESLRTRGAMDYTVVVSASASDSASMQYLAPYAGVAVAEYFMRKGKHVLVIYDDLSKHAVAYRELSLLLRRPPGREAYPGDVFYIHSRLLERAAKLSNELGGGSITALPIIETLAGDVSAYIPTNVISITDGQIFLETKLFYRGIRPAVNMGISVSRVGGAAQSKIMKKVAGTAKLGLAQYYELQAFAQFNSELDAESQKQILLGERLVEVLKQPAFSPRDEWQEVVLLYSAQKGYLNSFELSKIQSIVDYLIKEVGANNELVNEIKKSKEITENIDSSIKSIFEKISNEDIN